MEPTVIDLGRALPVYSVLPFAALLACIALLPLRAPHFWESNRNKALVSGVLTVGFAVALIAVYGAQAVRELEHALLDYASFLCLLGALFTISGGIYVRGSLDGTPLGNTALLAFGAVLANLIGTTGASMVLIRPFLRANRRRLGKTHLVVFFIFIVSNTAGLLTPLGDPPLFLGFLKGVPFEWTLRLWPEWLLVVGGLLMAFNLYDQRVFQREEAALPGSQLEEAMQHEPIGVDGRRNLWLLGGVIAAVLGKGQGWFNGGEPWPFGVQEGILIALAVGSLQFTPKEILERNQFSFGPIIEVAVLFLGIFVTMIAPLKLLNTHGAALGLHEPWQYFWATGLLSSVLDNAPTYLSFAAAAAGEAGVSADGGRYLADFLASGPGAELRLASIACGAVFMGAVTYIGNGPNFMVKAIAEENGVAMPSFFGYLRWSLVVLVPLFLGTTAVFFR